jgi:hypothetical protein
MTRPSLATNALFWAPHAMHAFWFPKQAARRGTAILTERCWSRRWQEHRRDCRIESAHRSPCLQVGSISFSPLMRTRCGAQGPQLLKAQWGCGAHCLTRNVTEQVPADDWGDGTESGRCRTPIHTGLLAAAQDVLLVPTWNRYRPRSAVPSRCRVGPGPFFGRARRPPRPRFASGGPLPDSCTAANVLARAMRDARTSAGIAAAIRSGQLKDIAPFRG